MIKIILADDHVVFRQSLSFMLSRNTNAQIIAEASNGRELINILENLDESKEPDVILMDIDMPEIDGIEATKLALKKNPNLKILTLSMFGDEKYYHLMIDAGVRGFVLKNADKAELEAAIKEVAEGGSWFSNDLLRRVIVSFNKQSKADNLLTKRETEVIKLICDGLTGEQIAKKLSLSFDTIRKHRSNLLSKTESTNTAALVMYAIKNKLVAV